MNQPLPTVRAIEAADLPAAHALSVEFGWPHRLEDWQFVHELGTGHAAFDAGRMVGTAYWWPQGDGFATIGMVVVSGASQGRGIGRRLMDTVLRETADRTLLLNATEAGRPLYEKLGFRPIGLVHQHQGASFSAQIVPLGPGERIRPAGREDEAALIALDAAASGLRRDRMLRALLRIAKGIVLDRDGSPVGFALFRRFGRGYVVGPVAAPDAEGAKALMSHWFGAQSGMFLRTDVTEASGLSGWLAQIGLERVGGALTMARGAPPAADGPTRMFALVSQALG